MVISSKGISHWQCPSNIAIIKYWGKHGLQLPENPSFSLTLQTARTETKAIYEFGAIHQKRNIEVQLDGAAKPGFVPKIEQLFQRIEADYPALKNIQLQLQTHNTFPHSSGIASSASAMGALASCIGEMLGFSDDLTEVSRIARLGSGSACRSIFPHGATWGKCENLAAASDNYAIPMSDQMHPIFKSFHDAILIVKSGEKSVSSTAGHNLMKGHPFAQSRYANARRRLNELIPALQSGDVDTFGSICEQEALELHALMMCSSPPYILIAPNTLHVIERIQRFRKETNVPAYFTLDAGPNIHFLYPEKHRTIIHDFIKSELVTFCENGFWINDQVGNGPSKLIINYV